MVQVLQGFKASLFRLSSAWDSMFLKDEKAILNMWSHAILTVEPFILAAEYPGPKKANLSTRVGLYVPQTCFEVPCSATKAPSQGPT